MINAAENGLKNKREFGLLGLSLACLQPPIQIILQIPYAPTDFNKSWPRGAFPDFPLNAILAQEGDAHADVMSGFFFGEAPFLQVEIHSNSPSMHIMRHGKPLW